MSRKFTKHICKIFNGDDTHLWRPQILSGKGTKHMTRRRHEGTAVLFKADKNTKMPSSLYYGRTVCAITEGSGKPKVTINLDMPRASS